MEYRDRGNQDMEYQRSMEEAREEVENAVNVLQLLAVGLEVNGDDGHIRRTVCIVEKMLRTALSRLREPAAD